MTVEVGVQESAHNKERSIQDRLESGKHSVPCSGAKVRRIFESHLDQFLSASKVHLHLVELDVAVGLLVVARTECKLALM